MLQIIHFGYYIHQNEWYYLAIIIATKTLLDFNFRCWSIHDIMYATIDVNIHNTSISIW